MTNWYRFTFSDSDNLQSEKKSTLLSELIFENKNTRTEIKMRHEIISLLIIIYLSSTKKQYYQNINFQKSEKHVCNLILLGFAE